MEKVAVDGIQSPGKVSCGKSLCCLEKVGFSKFRNKLSDKAFRDYLVLLSKVCCELLGFLCSETRIASDLRLEKLQRPSSCMSFSPALMNAL